VAVHPVLLSCEHAPPAFLGVSMHCPEPASQDPMPQSVDGQLLVPEIAHPPNSALQLPIRHPRPQVVLSGSDVHAVRCFGGSHFRQGLDGFPAPAG
jgi:hypothetical protein